ncbi:Hypothetical protein MVR_LOCUS121 [uncultured virus]|nr:Hypothetical protein MVR_LOCUS121 [uncultured virus]
MHVVVADQLNEQLGFGRDACSERVVCEIKVGQLVQGDDAFDVLDLVVVDDQLGNERAMLNVKVRDRVVGALEDFNSRQ